MYSYEYLPIAESMPYRLSAIANSHVLGAPSAVIEAAARQPRYRLNVRPHPFPQFIFELFLDCFFDGVQAPAGAGNGFSSAQFSSARFSSTQLSLI
jgi:hypothetical protein